MVTCFAVSGKAIRDQVMLNTNVGLICQDSDDVASTKDLQFFRGFQILCGSHSATPLPTSPLVTHLRTRGSPIGS